MVAPGIKTAPITRSASARADATEISHVAIVAGYSKAGQALSKWLITQASICIIDADMQTLGRAAARGILNVFGDAGRTEVLAAAGVEHARLLILTSCALHDKMRICAAARQLNPNITLTVGAGGDHEKAWLQEFGVTGIVSEPEQLARAYQQAIQRFVAS